MMRKHRITLGLALLCLLSACSSPSTGTALPIPTTPDPATNTTPSSTRPRTIELNGINPCSLVPQSDYAQLQIQTAGKRDTDQVFNSPECDLYPEFAALYVMLDVHNGIGIFTSGTLSAPTQSTPPVLGFPAIAVFVPDNADPGRCDIDVDVAPNEYLSASVEIDGGSESEFPPRCTYARELAVVAMTALLDRS